MESKLVTLSPSTEHPNSTLSTDRSKEFVRQEGLKEKGEMCLCCQLQQESQAAATARERAPTEREQTLPLGNKASKPPATSGSRAFHPLVPAAAERQHDIFFPPELSVLVLSIPHPSGHGNNETLGSETTGFLLSCSSVA